MFAATAWKIFNESIEKYHLIDRVDQELHNPHDTKEIAFVV